VYILVGSRKRVLINKIIVDQFKEKMENGITLQEAAYRLDIGHESVAELARKAINGFGTSNRRTCILVN
jgi:hypothetical protein